MVLAMKRMIFKEILSSKRTSIAFLVLDRVVRIRNIFPMIKEVKAIALISPSVCPSCILKK
jgi:hypothetical protein